MLLLALLWNLFHRGVGVFSLYIHVPTSKSAAPGLIWGLERKKNQPVTSINGHI